MPWPQTVDYNSAIQNPRHCFADPELAGGAAVDGMIPGIPLAYAGNFAIVYKVQGSAGVWAVKCFTRKVDNLTLRYKEISKHLKRHKPRFMVDFQYLEEGIQVEGAWYPVVKMQWVEGTTFNEFLRDHVGNTGLLEQLCHLWLRMGNDLRDVHMAHGDLQHGNVMLVPGSSAGSLLFRLVDYDGMWVPALAELPPNEVGHPNYQHPHRLAKGGFSAEVDRFSHLAIYTALRCLMAGGKSLWTAHDNAENVLFREVDFKAPHTSKLFPKLLALPDADAVALAGHLLLASQEPLDQVPLVGDLLSRKGVRPISAEQRNRLAALLPASQVPALESAPSTDWFLAETPPVSPPIVPVANAEQPTVTTRADTVEHPILDPLGVPFEQRKAAADLFARAAEVSCRGDFAYAQQLLLGSCKLDPTNLEHRKKLRESTRAAGGRKSTLFGSLVKLPARGRMRSARHAGDHRKVLEYGEELLTRLPGDVSTQIEMAEAAEALGMTALAVWLLKEACQQAPTDTTSLRAFARLCERLERYAFAAAIWKQVSTLVPTDIEAAGKIKELAAWEAIVRTTSLV